MEFLLPRGILKDNRSPSWHGKHVTLQRHVGNVPVQQNPCLGTKTQENVNRGYLYLQGGEVCGVKTRFAGCGVSAVRDFGVWGQVDGD